jgi:hypothetical protein
MKFSSTWEDEIWLDPRRWNLARPEGMKFNSTWGDEIWLDLRGWNLVQPEGIKLCSTRDDPISDRLIIKYIIWPKIRLVVPQTTRYKSKFNKNPKHSTHPNPTFSSFTLQIQNNFNPTFFSFLSFSILHFNLLPCSLLYYHAPKCYQQQQQPTSTIISITSSTFV